MTNDMWNGMQNYIQSQSMTITHFKLSQECVILQNLLF